MDLGGVGLRQWKTLKDCLKITFNFKNTPQTFTIASETAPHRPPQCRFQTYLLWPACSAASYWDRCGISVTFPDKSLFFFCNSRNVLCGGFSFQIKTNALQRHARRPGWALRLVVVVGDGSGIIGKARPFSFQTIQTGFGRDCASFFLWKRRFVFRRLSRRSSERSNEDRSIKGLSGKNKCSLIATMNIHVANSNNLGRRLRLMNIWSSSVTHLRSAPRLTLWDHRA